MANTKTGKPVGRPPKWETPEILQAEVDKYFEQTPEKEITISGLALFLNCFRETLCEYSKKDEFTNTVKKAKLRVANAYERDLRRQGRSGDIFALKNFGWSDNRGVDMTTQGEKLQAMALDPKLASLVLEAEKRIKNELTK